MQLQQQLEAIAGGIAERRFAVVEHFLSPQEAEGILKALKHAGGLHAAGIGSQSGYQINEAVRGDEVRWLERGAEPEVVAVWFEKVQLLMEYLNRSLYLGLKSFETHFAQYPPGSFYKRHLDNFRQGYRQTGHRRISFICYLNENWVAQDGGALRIYLPGVGGETSFDVLPHAGTLVCFPSDELEHEVLPATRDRFSLTGWMLDRLPDAKFL